MEVCGVAEEAGSLLTLVEASRPDVAIVDIRMPPTHTDEGLVAADEIRARFRGTGVLVLSQYVEPTYALRLLNTDSDARGYLLKDRVLNTAALVDALNRVAAGEVVVDPDLVAQLLSRQHRNDPLAELTTREREVLALVAEGLTDRGIAQRLWLTPRPSRPCRAHPAEAGHPRRHRNESPRACRAGIPESEP